MSTSKPYSTDHPQYPLLLDLAEGVDKLRRVRKMSRRQLAERSGLSERFIADVERCAANPSLLSLAQIADALETDVADLLTEASVVVPRLSRLLRGLTDVVQYSVAEELEGRFGKPDPARSSAPEKPRSVALVGLRGAGKTTVGELLAKALDCPFIELDKCIEEMAELSLSEIFEIHGEAYYRRLEREAVDEVLARDTRFVLATGGGLVGNTPAWSELRQHCVTIWLRAKPREHLMRVLNQGDRRPMEKRPHALAELESLLASRQPAYRQADQSIETTGIDPAALARRLAERLSEPDATTPKRRRSPSP